MFSAPKRPRESLLLLMVFSALVFSGCERTPAAPPASSPPPTPKPAPSPASAPTAAAEIAPASAQYISEQAMPVVIAPPPPAPPLLSRKIWPSVELADGRVFERVRVSAEDGATVTLMHTGGIAKVDKRTLPAEVAAAHPYDPVAAQIEANQTALRRQAAAAAPATTPVPQTPPPVPSRFVPPEPQPAAVNTRAIESAVRSRARRYFETEKRLGSGQTLSFNLITDLSEPREVAGWSNRWEVTGTAGYQVYDSVRWGSFSKRSTKFTAIVETPPGKKIVVVSFDESP
jgi:hypothetical protein